MKLIDKAALVAEIERRVEAIRKAFNEPGILSGVDRTYAYAQYEAFKSLFPYLDALDTKEVEEEPVSNDLEEAVKKYLTSLRKSHFEGYDIERAFEKGAKWQKERLMENAVEAVIHPYDGEIWVDKDLLSIYDDCQRVKLIIIKENKL